ncbi:hypothetical protein I4U23_020149 [Adineta vaga]|nr:hypothetical protein I4U23_020149 [Adineta vaga]
MISNNLQDIIVFLYHYINPLIFALGNFGNLFSLIIFFQKSWQRNVCVLYFKVYLLLSSLYLNSTILSFTFLIGYDINLYNLNLFSCKILYYLPCFISTLLPTILIFASIDRLLISSQKNYSRIYYSKSFAYIFIGLSTSFCLSFNSAILMKIKLQKTEMSAVHCSYDENKLTSNYFYYSLIISDAIFLIIIFILCILSLKTIDRIKTIPRQHMNKVRSISTEDFQLLRCLFTINLNYILTNLLSVIYSLYNEIVTHEHRNFFNDLFTFIGFSFYSSSFLIFYFISNSFRRKTKQFILNLCEHRIKMSRQKRCTINRRSTVVFSSSTTTTNV